MNFETYLTCSNCSEKIKKYFDTKYVKKKLNDFNMICYIHLVIKAKFILFHYKN